MDHLVEGGMYWGLVVTALNLRYHKMWGISQLAEEPLGSHTLCSMESAILSLK